MNDAIVKAYDFDVVVTEHAKLTVLAESIEDATVTAKALLEEHWPNKEYGKISPLTIEDAPNALLDQPICAHKIRVFAETSSALESIIADVHSANFKTSRVWQKIGSAIATSNDIRGNFMYAGDACYWRIED